MCICQSEMDTARRLEERDGEFEFTYMLHRKLVLGLRPWRVWLPAAERTDD